MYFKMQACVSVRSLVMPPLVPRPQGRWWRGALPRSGRPPTFGLGLPGFPCRAWDGV
eukprot:SAG11_NODE_20199_length_450_cov_2.321937_1_plen_56_part_10